MKGLAARHKLSREKLKKKLKKKIEKKNRLKTAITLQREVVRQSLTHHMVAPYGRFSKLKTVWCYDQWFKSYIASKFQNSHWIYKTYTELLYE